MTESPRSALWIAAGASLAVLGVALGAIGTAGHGTSWTIAGAIFFTVGWAIAAAGAAKAGYRLGRGGPS